MNAPRTLEEAAELLALTFQDIAGLKPKVTLMGRDEFGRAVVAVAYRGDELVRAMQIEAYVTERGETIRHRSQVRHGNTILVYQIERKPQAGGYHLSTVKPPRVVPSSERHKWSGKVNRPGHTATCSRCGCVKTIERNQGDWLDSFQMPGQPAQRTRPACTGKV